VFTDVKKGVNEVCVNETVGKYVSRLSLRKLELEVLDMSIFPELITRD
jgi:hypothetical protein